MIKALSGGKPPQIPPQTRLKAKQKEAFYRFLMQVPGTGDDPVTSCFSDTLAEIINDDYEASGSAEVEMIISSLGAFMRP